MEITKVEYVTLTRAEVERILTAHIETRFHRKTDTVHIALNTPCQSDQVIFKTYLLAEDK